MWRFKFIELLFSQTESKTFETEARQKKKDNESMYFPSTGKTGSPPRYWVRWFTGAQLSIWIIALRHNLPTEVQEVKFNSFHPEQQKNYLKLTMQLTVAILAYSLLVLVQISKVISYFENIKKKKKSNYKKRRYDWNTSMLF